jgi:hypothetical protein
MDLYLQYMRVEPSEEDKNSKRTHLETDVTHSVGWLDFGLNDRGSIPDRGNERIVFLCHRVQTGSGTHPAS